MKTTKRPSVRATITARLPVTRIEFEYVDEADAN